MLPDLRFVIGAVMATALLGVTLFGLAAAMHISHQSKVGPLEASRLLAYAPESRHRIFDIPARRFDDPFANIPAVANPVPLATAGGAARTVGAANADRGPRSRGATRDSARSRPISDADTVDERAVVDPPLPPDGDVPAAAAEATPAAAEAVPAAPSPEPSAASAPPVETQPAAPSPVAEKQIEPAADVPQVGSIPATTDAAETRSEPPASQAPQASEVPSVAEADEPAQAKRKRAAREGEAAAGPTRHGAAAAAADQPVRHHRLPVRHDVDGQSSRQGVLAPRLIAGVTASPARASATAGRCR